MKELRYTLLSDGSSDQALLPILTWLLREHHVGCAIQSEWADLRRLARRPQTLPGRIIRSLELYPCALLFVHRDAERESREHRKVEINRAIAEASQSVNVPVRICVVPVRMQEAWLLFDEAALRRAAGNPNGRQPLEIPPHSQLEQLPDHTHVRYKLLREASGLQGRRRKKIPVGKWASRIAAFITDFTPLRALPAFNALENDVEHVIREQEWSASPETVKRGT